MIAPASEPKGQREGGPCNRTACQKPGARYWNTSTRAWYCDDCAGEINRANRDAPLCVTRVSLPPLAAAAPTASSAIAQNEETPEVLAAARRYGLAHARVLADAKHADDAREIDRYVVLKGRQIEALRAALAGEGPR